MKILPMYENKPGAPDLVYHTAKHFLDELEAGAWDQVPIGTLTAAAARAGLRGEGLNPPETPSDIRWWWPPWAVHARKAHEQGYRPRYLGLIELAGDPVSGRWQDVGSSRRLMEFVGFRVIVEARGDEFQVVTAFFSPLVAGASNLPRLAPALRAFAARLSCPPGDRSGVKAKETKP